MNINYDHIYIFNAMKMTRKECQQSTVQLNRV